MTLGAVPEVLDISHVGQSGVAAQRLHTFLASITSTLGSITSPFSYKGSIAVNTSFPLVAVVQTGDFYTITADVTDNAGATYTNTGLAFLSGEEIVWNGSTWVRVGSALTNPLQYKGVITLAADFPVPTGSTGVKSGHVYLIAAPVIDNDATKTNTTQVFTTSDTIQWNGTGWTVLAPQNGLNFRGDIAAPTAFPLLSLVKIGHVYRVTSATNDTGGVTYTNTGLSFKEGDVIMWNGSSWTTLGNKVDIQVTAVTPVVLASNDSINIVDTATLGAPSAVALPAAVAAMVGRKITICDGSGMAGTHNIVITPNTTHTIDGVNAPVTIDKNYGYITLLCITSGKWITSGYMTAADKTKLDGIEAAADVTDAANVAAAGAVMESDYTAYTVLAADTSATPAPLTMAASTTVARLAAGGIVAASVAQMQTLYGIDTIVDDHVTAHCTGLDIKTDEIEVSAALSGLVSKTFVPTHLILKVVTNVGALNADGTVNVGTSADGAQIAAAVALTGLTSVGATRVVPLAANTSTVLGNATLYANVESAETGAGTLALDVYVIGRQV